MISRRSFVKVLAALGGALLLPLDRLVGSHVASGAQAQGPAPAAGELYEGFLLLPEGAPVPDFVKYPTLGIPIVGEAGDRGKAGEFRAVTSCLDTPADLAKMGRFPVYTLGKLPPGFRPAGASLMRHQSGQVFAGGVSFESRNDSSDSWERTVSIVGRPDFPRPFPLRSAEPHEAGGPAVVLEKLDSLPSRGVMVRTAQGYVFHWIQWDVLYTAKVECGSSQQQALELLAGLELVV